MNRKNITVALAVVVLLFLNFFVRPSLRRKDAVKAVKTVLKHWKNGDLTLAMPYWEKEKDSPPVYGLMSYKIGKGEVNKKDGMYRAHVTATLDFPPGNILPSGNTWVFKLNKTRYGWKITDFLLLEDGMPQ